MAHVADLADYFLEAVDQAAIASADWRGKGDKNAADAAAVEAMRKTFDKVPFDGRVAIGEGERDEAPMLFIGETLGCEIGNPNVPHVDIAVDPLECTNNCADNLPNSIAVLAAAPRGTLLHAPDCYMDKIAAGPALEGEISLDGGVAYNIEQVSSVLDKPTEEVKIIALDRERHNQLFKEIRELVLNYICYQMEIFLQHFGLHDPKEILTCCWGSVLHQKGHYGNSHSRTRWRVRGKIGVSFR